MHITVTCDCFLLLSWRSSSVLLPMFTFRLSVSDGHCLAAGRKPPTRLRSVTRIWCLRNRRPHERCIHLFRHTSRAAINKFLHFWPDPKLNRDSCSNEGTQKDPRAPQSAAKQASEVVNCNYIKHQANERPTNQPYLAWTSESNRFAIGEPTLFAI